MASLRQEMLRHAAEPVRSDRLLQHLENFEMSGLPSDARLLARDCQYLAVGGRQRNKNWESGLKPTTATPTCEFRSPPSCSTS